MLPASKLIVTAQRIPLSTEYVKKTVNPGCALTARWCGEHRKKAVLHFNAFDLRGKSYIRPHPSPPYCTAVLQQPQSSHNTGNTHVHTNTRTHTSMRTPANMSTQQHLIAVSFYVTLLKNASTPVCKHLLQLYLWKTNYIQDCANYCRCNTHMGTLHCGSTVGPLHILMCRGIQFIWPGCVAFCKSRHSNNSKEVEALSLLWRLFSYTRHFPN